MRKVSRRLLISVGAMMIVAGAMVAQQSLIHRVVEGDTLWDLAGHYLQNSFSWPLIWEANKDKIEDPHWIYPGQELVIPPLAASGPIAAPDTTAPAVVPEPQPEPEVVEIVPEEPQITKPKVGPKQAGIIGVRGGELPVVSEALAFISGYLSTDPEKPLGRFVKAEHLDGEYLKTNDKVYINLGVRDGTKPGDRFAVYRLGPRVKHPKGGRDLGRMVQIVGLIQVEEVSEQGARAKIVKCFQPLGRQETIKPYVEVLVPKNVKPMPATKTDEGFIVALAQPELAATTYKVAYIDKGLADGVMPGDIYEIYRKQPEVSDPDRGGKIRLPDRVVGTVQVLAVRNNTSSAYISSSYVEDIKVGETIRLVKQVPGR